jgi:hypothetical protein
VSRITEATTQMTSPKANPIRRSAIVMGRTIRS